MEIKILQVFYDKNGLPYKDKERTVHYPITSGTFLGASNTTQIKFYYDQLDELNESTFVAVSKLPNGKIGSEILESEYDSELEENYAVLNLSSFYTQYKGDVYISLQGYQGGVKVEQDENGIYQIYGTPTIQATGSIKLSIAYAPTFIGSGQTENITLQRVLAELSTKLGIRQETLHVEELPTVGNPNVWYVVNDDPNDTTKANIYIWNATTQTYVWVGDNTLDLGNYYTQEQGEQFEEEVRNTIGNGSPKGVYATVNDLQTAYPTGTTGIYVVSADGHWYYWNGSVWTDGGVYLSTGDAVPDSRKIAGITLENDISKEELYNSLLDYDEYVRNCKAYREKLNSGKETITQLTPSLSKDNYLWDSKTNTELATNGRRYQKFTTGFNVGDLIEIKGVTTYTSYEFYTAIAFYDENDELIIQYPKYFAENIDEIIAIPVGTSYFIINGEIADNPSVFEIEYDTDYAKSLSNKVDYWNKGDPKMFGNEIEVLDNHYLNGNTVGDGESFASFRYLKVEPEKTYNVYNSYLESGQYTARFVNFFDKEKTLISTIELIGSSFTTPVNCHFISVTLFKTAYSSYTTMNWYITDKADRKNEIVFEDNVRENNNEKYLEKAKRIATINFIFDDGSSNDALIYNIFENHGLKCGFALLSTIDADRYLDYQEQGYEVLSHSINGNGMNDPTTSPSVIENALKQSLIILGQKGYKIRGWVTPSSAMNEVFLPLLAKYYDYGFTKYFGEYDGTGQPYQTPNDNTYKLYRVSLQSTTLANQKAAVDLAIANGGFLTFYGHAADLDGTDNLTTNNLNELLTYINQKQNDLQCYCLTPSKAFDYYYHTRSNDIPYNPKTFVLETPIDFVDNDFQPMSNSDLSKIASLTIGDTIRVSIYRDSDKTILDGTFDVKIISGKSNNKVGLVAGDPYPHAYALIFSFEYGIMVKQL